MNRNPEVDQWFDQADHPLDATMRRAREIILGADDRAWCDWKADSRPRT
jgi:hypothetical protein